MCAAKCHFGPCPPCSKKDVTARCRCGKVRQQLAFCSQVWIDGKQLVLDCTEDCKKELPPTAEDVESPLAADCETSAVTSGDAGDIEGLRQRRKEEKQRRREEEQNERRLRQEQEDCKRLRRRRLRKAGVGFWALLMLTALVWFVKVLWDQKQERLQQELLARPQGKKPGKRKKAAREL